LRRRTEKRGSLSDESDDSVNNSYQWRSSFSICLQGVDTTTTAMGFFLNVMGLFPDIQQKVFEEDENVQKLLNGDEVTFDDLRHYEYTERVIKETLRMFPVGAILGRRTTEDLAFGKYWCSAPQPRSDK